MLKKKSLWFLTAVFFWVFLAGMAKQPGPDVPVPDVDFKATVRDDQDISTKLTHASWDGNTFFTGTRGKGTVTIAFEKVKKITSTGAGTATKNDFQITLKSGDVVAVSFDHDSRFMGSTSFGSFRILVKNIREITFE